MKREPLDLSAKRSRLSTPVIADVRKAVNLSVDDIKPLEAVVRRHPEIAAFEPRERAIMREFVEKANRPDETSKNSSAVQFYLRRLQLYQLYFNIPKIGLVR